MIRTKQGFRVDVDHGSRNRAEEDIYLVDGDVVACENILVTH